MCSLQCLEIQYSQKWIIAKQLFLSRQVMFSSLLFFFYFVLNWVEVWVQVCFINLLSIHLLVYQKEFVYLGIEYTVFCSGNSIAVSAQPSRGLKYKDAKVPKLLWHFTVTHVWTLIIYNFYYLNYFTEYWIHYVKYLSYVITRTNENKICALDLYTFGDC